VNEIGDCCERDQAKTSTTAGSTSGDGCAQTCARTTGAYVAGCVCKGGCADGNPPRRSQARNQRRVNGCPMYKPVRLTGPAPLPGQEPRLNGLHTNSDGAAPVSIAEPVDPSKPASRRRCDHGKPYIQAESWITSRNRQSTLTAPAANLLSQGATPTLRPDRCISPLWPRSPSLCTGPPDTSRRRCAAMTLAHARVKLRCALIIAGPAPQPLG
jgi:hypothetical protein